MDFDLNSIKKFYYFKSTKNETCFQNISEDITLDLDLDFVFFKLDKTISKIGKQFFYSKFRIIEKETDVFHEKYLKYFKSSNSESIEDELNKINKFKDYEIIDLINDEIIINNKYLSFAKLSTLTLLIVIILGAFVKQMFVFMIFIFSINAFYHYKNKSYVEYYNSIISRLQKTLSTANKISKKSPIFTKEYSKINLKKLENSIWMTNVASQLSNNEFFVLFWLLFEVFQITFNLEIFIFTRNAKILNNSKSELLKIFEYIGKIDSAINIVKIEKEYKTCKPIFNDEKLFEFVKIYHPLIDNCIENDLELNQKSIVLTGSNMSGKTSFMRCIAINTIMAQSFNFCFAEKFKAPFMQILSSISIQDDINESKSYYLEEVLRIKNFLEAESGFNFILIDEIFRGTNTKERIAISKAVLKSLNSSKNIVFITTHDLEIAKFLENYDYELYYFAEDLNTKVMKFTYKLHHGINSKTNAIKLLEIHKYPKSIVEDSYRML